MFLFLFFLFFLLRLLCPLLWFLCLVLAPALVIVSTFFFLFTLLCPLELASSLGLQVYTFVCTGGQTGGKGYSMARAYASSSSSLQTSTSNKQQQHK